MCQAPNKKKQVVDSQELLKKHAVAYCQLRTASAYCLPVSKKYVGFLQFYLLDLTDFVTNINQKKQPMSDNIQNPDYYQTVMPYLILKNVAEFLEFTKKVFAAEEKMKYLDDDGRIVHTEIVIGDSTIMAGESNKDWSSQPAGLYINVESADETYQKAIEAGAESVMDLSDKEYGRTGGVKDSNGNTWWITSKL